MDVSSKHLNHAFYTQRNFFSHMKRCCVGICFHDLVSHCIKYYHIRKNVKIVLPPFERLHVKHS